MPDKSTPNNYVFFYRNINHVGDPREYGSEDDFKAQVIDKYRRLAEKGKGAAPELADAAIKAAMAKVPEPEKPAEDDPSPNEAPDLEAMTKEELEAHAREQGVELDRRKSKANMLADFQAAVA